MFAPLKLTGMAQAMAAQAGRRLDVIARNVANADTPGFQAMDMPAFAESHAAAGLALRATRPGHLGGDPAEVAARRDKTAAAPNGNSVALEQEMVKSASARAEHDMALAVYRSSAEILRASLGKAR